MNPGNQPRINDEALEIERSDSVQFTSRRNRRAYQDGRTGDLEAEDGRRPSNRRHREKVLVEQQ